MFVRVLTYAAKIVAALLFSLAVGLLTGWVVQYLYKDVTDFGAWLARGLGFTLSLVTCLTGGGVGRQPWDRKSVWDDMVQERMRRAAKPPRPAPEPELPAWTPEPVVPEPAITQPTLPLVEPVPVADPAALGVRVQAVTAMEWLDFLNQVADRSDELLMQRFRRAGLVVRDKADGTPVSEADEAVEHAVRACLQERYPAVGIWGEEQGETRPGALVRLIVDPLDGTQNYLRGIPFFATLLAVEQNGEIVAGLVSAPALFTRWSAGRGLGAFRGRNRMRVSAVDDLAKASLFYGDLTPAPASGQHWALLPLIQRVKRARGFGDFYQHVLVAEGAGEIAIDPEIQPWDVAPFMVIVEEAGGTVSSLRGERSFGGGSFVSSNGRLHDQAMAILAVAASQSKLQQPQG